jgi:peptidoglycan/xylan/chitin deacetylase (PgdA/CDA1 family)
MLIFMLIGLTVVALAHTAPAPFVLDALTGDTSVWRMPPSAMPTVYFTYDDGPNAATTPDLLDVLARERVPATFFLIDRHVRDETAWIVRRMFDEGHSVALHSATRAYMLMTPPQLAGELTRAAERIRDAGGSAPCRAFRPHAGWRGGQMYEGLRQIDYQLVGWGWMLWDFNWFRGRTANGAVSRIAPRAGDGDIIVMHDGDESAPDADQRHTVEATARLIPILRSRGLAFGTVCRNGGNPNATGHDAHGVSAADGEAFDE